MCSYWLDVCCVQIVEPYAPLVESRNLARAFHGTNLKKEKKNTQRHANTNKHGTQTDTHQTHPTHTHIKDTHTCSKKEKAEQSFLCVLKNRRSDWSSPHSDKEAHLKSSVELKSPSQSQNQIWFPLLLQRPHLDTQPHLKGPSIEQVP